MSQAASELFTKILLTVHSFIKITCLETKYQIPHLPHKSTSLALIKIFSKHATRKPEIFLSFCQFSLANLFLNNSVYKIKYSAYLRFSPPSDTECSRLSGNALTKALRCACSRASQMSESEQLPNGSKLTRNVPENRTGS